MGSLDFRPDVIGDVRDEPEPALPRAEYREDDWIAEVEILEDRSMLGREAYRLRVLRTIRISQLHPPTPDGDEFDCWQRSGAGVFTLMRR